jgi:hypothetical protein
MCSSDPHTTPPSGSGPAADAAIDASENQDRAVHLLEATLYDADLLDLAAEDAHGFPEHAKDVCKTIIDDMTQLSSLSLQKKLFGPLLKQPLPLSLLDSRGRPIPQLATELMPYAGKGPEQFHNDLVAATSFRDQQRNVVVVTQASGSGKSRLAYAEGMTESLVVFVRIAMQGDKLAPPWKAYVDLVDSYRHGGTAMDTDAKLGLAQHALSAMQLLIACYARWVLLVLK